MGPRPIANWEAVWPLARPSLPLLRLRDEEQRHIDRDHDAGRDPQTEHAKETTRDPYIEQASKEARERQESWERGIDLDRDNDRGFGIE